MDKPTNTSTEYRWYRGNIDAARTCLSYLVDDESYINKAPEKYREIVKENYLKGTNEPISYFKQFFVNKFAERFDEVNKLEIPIKYKGKSSPGAYMRKAGFKNKKQFIKHPESPRWITLFMTYAHRYNWIEPYTAAIKEEMTSVKDIESGKCRIFYVAGIYTDIVGKMLCNNFNVALESLDWCKVGWVPQYGGIPEFREKMESFIEDHPECDIIEADCTKFDLGRIKKLFDMTLDLRALFCREDHRIYLPLLRHLYDCAIKKYLVWFDGHIKVCSRGNPSGWPNTTADNSLDNYFFWWYIVVWLKDYDAEYFLHLMLNIVSDDCINCIPTDCCDEQFLASAYAHYGRIFKEVPRECNKSMDNRLFLGCRFLPDGKYDIAWEKCLWSSNFRRGLTEEQFEEKLQALAANVAGNPELLSQLEASAAANGYTINTLRAKYTMTGVVDF